MFLFWSTRSGPYSMDWVKGEGNPYSYFTYGVACSEVEVDLLTGDHRVLRTDIVMDVGESLNPGIDIGQVEGGFAQGYGLFMMEEHVFLDGNEKMRGTMVTTGPGAYKIPGFSDIPVEFNVSLLKGVPNKRAIYSSKVWYILYCCGVTQLCTYVCLWSLKC